MVEDCQQQKHTGVPPWWTKRFALRRELLDYGIVELILQGVKAG
jgi:hypothetical protein